MTRIPQRRNCLAASVLVLATLILGIRGAWMPDRVHAADPVAQKASDVGYFESVDLGFGGITDYEDDASFIFDLDGAGTVVFSATGPENLSPSYKASRLWITSGPSTETRLKDDLFGHAIGSDGAGTVFIAGSASPTMGNPALWKTDGTPAGTTLVKNIAGLGAVAMHNGELYLEGADASGIGLWKSDGTSAGTIEVKSGIRPLGAGVSAGSYVFFPVLTASNVLELWRSDGTPAGTILLKASNPGPGRDLELLGTLGSEVLFSTFDALGAEGLWKTDGTVAGTQLVKEIGVAEMPISADLDARVLNDELYFGGVTAASGLELWKTDGTTAGTVMVKDINPGMAHGAPIYGQLLAFGGVLLFNANDGVHGSELWKTDGTAAGTSMVKDIWAGSSSSADSSAPMVATNDKAYFQARTAGEGFELWFTDGTAAGTQIVVDICPGTCPGLVDPQLTLSGETVYFRAMEEAPVAGVNNGGTDIWRIAAPSDGDADGMSDDFETGFGGTVPEDSLMITNTENGDEATGSGSAATGTEITSGSFEIDLPPDTTVDTAGGASQIAITLDATDPNAAKVQVSGADLAGGTKSVVMPFDANASEPAVCIDDSPTASIDAILIGGNCNGTIVAIPASVGDTVTVGDFTVKRQSNSPPQVRVSGLSHTALATISLGSPTITELLATVAPVAVGTSITAAADFFDTDGNTTGATVDWGDGATTTGTLDNTAGTVSAAHVYDEAGVYSVTITLTDADGNVGSATYQYVVVYDPNGGFVTGGGWIDSPAGAFTADPDRTGRATFGFVARYSQGKTVPEGNTEFHFKAGDLRFKSNGDYMWLVVSGSGHKATYKGTGTVNGEGNYGFMVTAIDATNTSSTDDDVFRIKIWDEDDGDAVIYDNHCGSSGDDADPCTRLGGGSIKIHK